MSHLHLCCLDLVDERGQPGGVEYFRDVDSGPADNEITGPRSLPVPPPSSSAAASSGSCDLSDHRGPSENHADRWDWGLELGTRTIHRVSIPDAATIARR